MIASETKKEIPSDVFNYLMTNIEHLDFDEKINLIYDIIFKNSIENQSINNLSDLFFITVLEQIKDKPHKSYVLSYFQSADNSILNDNIYKFYQLLCLFSIAKIHTTKLSKLINVWENFISFCNKYDMDIVGYLHNWVRYVSIIDIDDSNINAIIVSKQEDNFLSFKLDSHNLFSEFINGVIYSLFIKIKSNNQFDIQTLLNLKTKEVIQKLVKEENLIFLDWLGKNNTELYPSKEICLNNIIENDRLVLKQDNRILVRIKKQIENQDTIPFTKYEYLKEFSEHNEKAFNESYKSIIYEFESNDYQTLETALSKQSDLISVIDILLKVKDSIYKFKLKYHPNTSKFPNIVSGEINLSNDYFPLIPYSIFDNKPVFNEFKPETINNEGKFLGSLLNLINKSEKLSSLSLLGYLHPNHVTSKNLLREEKSDDSFIPVNQKNDISSKFAYLESFINNIQQTKHLRKSAFTVEYAKFMSIYDLTLKKFKDENKLRENEIIPKLLYEVLYNYLSLYKEKEFFKKIIFDISKEPTNTNLVELFYSLKISIVSFIKKMFPALNHPFINLFEYELLKLNELCSIP